MEFHRVRATWALVISGCLVAHAAALEPDIATNSETLAQGRLVQLEPIQAGLTQPTQTYAPYVVSGPGAGYPQAGMVYSQPGTMVGQPNIVYAQPGAMQPGVAYPQPGVVYSDPGMVYPQMQSGGPAIWPFSSPNAANCVPYVQAAPYACRPKQNCVALFGDFLYLRPRGVDVAYALPQDGFGFLGAAPMGAVATVDPKYSPGFRVGGAFRTGVDSQITLAYTWFHSTDSNSITTTAPLVINPLPLFPGTFNFASLAEQATAAYTVNFQFADIDYSSLLWGNDCRKFGYILGASYGTLTQKFNATFPFAPADGVSTLATTSNFTGAGLRLGLEGEQRLGSNTGVMVYGRGVSRFLAGHFRESYQQTNQFSGSDASTSAKENRIVPVLDLELGLGWVGRGGHVRLSGGYLISAWYNVITTPGWISSVQNTSFGGSSNTLTFDGLVARAEVQF